MVHVVVKGEVLRPIISRLINMKELEANAVGNILEVYGDILQNSNQAIIKFLDSKNRTFNGNFANSDLMELSQKQRLFTRFSRGI